MGVSGLGKRLCEWWAITGVWQLSIEDGRRMNGSLGPLQPVDFGHVSRRRRVARTMRS
jgi:hypothetical protein